MNLNDIKLNESAWMDVYSPDGEKTDMRIELVSRDSQKYQSKIRRLADKNRKAVKGLDIQTVEKETMNIYVACTVGWENVEEDGEVLTCSHENIEHVYMVVPFIYEQVREFIEDRANFLAN